MRRRPNEIVLFDLKTGPTTISMFGENAPMLIDPQEAINWIANGTIGDVLGPRRWTALVGAELTELVTRTDARFELAEEMVVSAILSGRIRCVNADTDVEGHPRLSYIDPGEFDGKEIYHEWDEGLSFQIGSDSDDEDLVQFDKFWFFWDEITIFVPRRPDDSGRYDPPVGSSAGIAPATPVALLHAPDRIPPIVQSHMSESSKRRGRGRPAGKNGEPIAMFVLRAQAEGIDNLEPLADDALGAMLKEEYVRLGLNVPENSNAARDARGVIRALVNMQVKFDSQAAE